MRNEFKEYYQNKEVADSYDSQRFRGFKGQVVRNLELTYADWLTGKPKKQKILEIGVGTGFISKMLFSKGEFYGRDISEEMIKKTKKLLPGAKLSKGDILNLKKGERFDMIVTIRVISHFNREDALKALQSIKSILKENGTVVFNLENRSLFRRLMRKITKWGSTHTYQYSQKDIEALVEEAGLKQEEAFYLDHLFMLPLHVLNKVLFDRLEKPIVKLELNMKHISYFSNNSFLRCRM